MNQRLYIKLCDAKNRLLRKTELIEQFIAANRVVQEALQRMPNGERRENLFEAYQKIWEANDFDPYDAKKSLLKEKISEMQQIIMKYNLGKQK